MAGVGRVVAVASVVLSVVVTGAIAANPTPWRAGPAPTATSGVTTRGSEPDLSARARAVLDRARAVQERLDDLASPATQATPSPPPAVSAQPAPPPVAITSAPAVTSSASS